MKRKLPRWELDLFLSLICALILGALLAAASAGAFFQSWLAFGSILVIGIFVCLQVWRLFGSSRALAALMAVTLALRLLVAVAVMQALPVWGYDNPVNNGGFLYSDAFDRDQAAFKLASQNQSLFTAFSAPDKSDQYGGLLFLTAATYRVLSPDVARPLLISLLSALAMTVGIAFLWAAVQKRWSKKIALITCWIVALFPDSVFLGSSQMREPFLIGLCCIALWGILKWREKPVHSLLIAAAAIGVAFVFSIPAAGIFSVVIGSILLLEVSLAQTKKLPRLIGLGLLIVLALGAVVAGWFWLKPTLYFDSFTTMTQSGWISALITQYGDRFTIPFTTVYGLTQPMLPAAIVDPSVWIWKTVAILRALGWYAALPFLFYAFVAVWKAPKNESKWVLILLNLIFFLWVVISSARAGGDQWDNPRYRYFLLPFMALIIAWGWEHYRQTRSPWLWGCVAIIAEFLVLFINFYINRFTRTSINLPLFKTLKYSAIAALLILAICAVIDLLRHRSQKLQG